MLVRGESALSTIWTLFVRMTLLVIVVYVVWRVRSILITVILSVMLAYVLLPVVDFLCRRRPFRALGKRWARLGTTVFVFIAFFFIVAVAGKVMFTPFKAETLKAVRSVDSYYESAQSAFTQAQHWYVENIPADLRKFLGEQDFKGLGASVVRFITRITRGTLDWFRYAVELVLIPVLAFYFVLDSRWLKREFIALVPPRRMREAMRLLRETSGILQRYVIGQLILCLIAGVVTYIVLSLLHVNYALVLAVLAGVTRAIPIIGPVVSGIPICTVGALQSLSLGLWLLGFVVVMHFSESKFIMPILIGDRMRLHPAVILIALLIGAEFFGLLGMFLAAPIAAIIRELLYRYVVLPRRKRLDSGKDRASSPTLFGSEQA